MALKIEVIAIGNEILTGFTVNTNAAFIGQELLNIGLKVTSQRTLPDDHALLQAGLEHSLANFDLIICTGGLGPTCDDQTRQIIADVFNCELKFEPKIAAYLESKYKNRQVSIKDQAMIPSKADYILNEIGTASALLFNHYNKLIIFLPGVPAEFKYLVNTKIIPLLKTKYADQTKEFHQQCNFMQLSESQIDPVLRELSQEYPTVEFGIYPNLGLINVHIISHFATEQANLLFQQPIKYKLITAFKDHFFSDQNSDIAEVIWPLCLAQNLTIGIIQTTPFINLISRLAPVAPYNKYIADPTQTIEQLVNIVKQESVCNTIVAITNIPDLPNQQEIYSTDLTLGLQLPGQELVIKTFSIRGNKSMLIRRAENLVLSELFRAISA